MFLLYHYGFRSSQVGALRSTLKLVEGSLVTPFNVSSNIWSFVFFRLKRRLRGFLFEGLVTFFSCMYLDLMVGEVLEAKMLFVKLLVTVDVQGTDKSLREFLVILLLTMLLATACAR